MKTKQYFKNICTVISVSINVILGGNPYQTLSARNWQLKRAGRFNYVKLIDSCFWFEPDHCQASWCNWKVRTGISIKHETEELIRNEKLNEAGDIESLYRNLEGK